MASTTINLSDLDADTVASLVAQIKAQDEAKAKGAKVLREQSKALTLSFVEQVVNTLPVTTFTSTAQGYSLGGSKFVVAGKSYRVQLLIRDEATIPDKDDK